MTLPAPPLGAEDEPIGFATTPARHTMLDRLADYVLPKVPVRDLATCRGRAHVTGTATLDALERAKSGPKRFNWRRPAFTSENGILSCAALPGRDYTYHYARLLATAAALVDHEPIVLTDLPDPTAGVAFIDQLMPHTMPVPEVVVLGYVDQLFARHDAWTVKNGFGWALVDIGRRRVALIGCEFSYWGDLAGALVTVLAARGARWVIYVGKLGTLTPSYEPNYWVATGTTSQLQGSPISWRSRLAATIRPGGRVLTGLRHITLASTLDETISWYTANAEVFDVVDPEIGHMAAAAIDADIAYDYLHIISDNLTGRYAAGLYDERSRSVRTARQACFRVIESTLEQSVT